MSLSTYMTNALKLKEKLLTQGLAVQVQELFFRRQSSFNEYDRLVLETVIEVLRNAEKKR